MNEEIINDVIDYWHNYYITSYYLESPIYIDSSYLKREVPLSIFLGMSDQDYSIFLTNTKKFWSKTNFIKRFLIKRKIIKNIKKEQDYNIDCLNFAHSNPYYFNNNNELVEFVILFKERYAKAYDLLKKLC